MSVPLGRMKVPRPPSAAPSAAPTVTITEAGTTAADENSTNTDDKDSGIPAWARRGISWRSVREVFDDNFIPEDERTDDMIELETQNLNTTMRRYATLYDSIGLA